MNTRYILLAIFSLMLFSCYNEDDIVVEKGENKYDFQDSDDAVEKYVYNYHKDYGVAILFDYETSDYTWNITYSEMGSAELTKAKEENKAAGIEYAKRVFLELYPIEFRKTQFPFKVLMAESVQAFDWMIDGMKDFHSKTGKGHVSIGMINETTSSFTTEELYAARAAINGEFWHTFMMANRGFKLPESFLKVSEGYYFYYLGDDGIPEEYGFVFSQWGETPGQYFDIRSYLEFMFGNPQAKIQEVCNQYPKVKQKYDIIAYVMKEYYGFDITTIEDL